MSTNRSQTRWISATMLAVAAAAAVTLIAPPVSESRPAPAASPGWDVHEYDPPECAAYAASVGEPMVCAEWCNVDLVSGALVPSGTSCCVKNSRKDAGHFFDCLHQIH